MLRTGVFASFTPLALLALLPSKSLAQQCWLPDGVETLKQKACPGVNDTSPGPCCYYDANSSTIDPCLSNGFCMNAESGWLYQGACTSKGWLGCKNECFKYYGADYAVITPCYWPQNQSLYCCGFIGDSRTRDCCSNQEGHDFSDNGRIPTFLGPLNASTLSNITDTSGETVNALVAVESSSTCSAEPTPKADLVSKETMIGVGVALGVTLAIALGSIVWLSVLLRRQRTVHQPLPQNEHYSESKSWLGYVSTASPPVSPPVELGAKHAIPEVSSERLPVEVSAGRM